MDRRTVLGTLVAGTLIPNTTTPAALTQQDNNAGAENEKSSGKNSDNKPSQPTKNRDMDFVMEAGMTAEEAECWSLIAKAAGAFFKLPELHPMDNQEVATAIHVVQNKLLARPTYRKYLKLAKAAHGEKKNESP